MKLTKKQEKVIKQILDEQFYKGADFVIKFIRDVITQSLNDGYIGVKHSALLEYISDIENRIRRGKDTTKNGYMK